MIFRLEIPSQSIRGEDTDGTSVASVIEKMKMMKVAADLSPEEEQTMSTLVLRYDTIGEFNVDWKAE